MKNSGGPNETEDHEHEKLGRTEREHDGLDKGDQDQEKDHADDCP